MEFGSGLEFPLLETLESHFFFSRTEFLMLSLLAFFPCKIAVLSLCLSVVWSFLCLLSLFFSVLSAACPTKKFFLEQCRTSTRNCRSTESTRFEWQDCKKENYPPNENQQRNRPTAHHDPPQKRKKQQRKNTRVGSNRSETVQVKRLPFSLAQMYGGVHLPGNSPTP